MAQPAIIRNIYKYKSVILNKSLKVKYCKNMSTDWKSEKQRILDLDVLKRRKLYKCGAPVTLELLDTWAAYCPKNDLPYLESCSAEDREILSKFAVNKGLNGVLGEKISLFKGDITALEIDAIVNAANSKLLGGGGVDGAIHRAAGPLLLEECKTLNGCETGQAKITGGYRLPAKYVIHTVGPMDKNPEKLKACYENCLKLAVENNLRSIAFPCISTGVYGYPNNLAGHVAMQTVRKHLEDNPGRFDRVIFCLFMPVDIDFYHKLMQGYFPVHCQEYRQETHDNC